MRIDEGVVGAWDSVRYDEVEVGWGEEGDYSVYLLSSPGRVGVTDLIWS